MMYVIVFPALSHRSTGSFGWYMNGKTLVTIDGKPVSVQIGMNLTVVGSKDAARE